VNSNADVAGLPGDTVCETAPGDGICTLRAAIMAANHLLTPGATIIIPAGTIKITQPPSGLDDEASGDFNINASMTIKGAGALATILDANYLDRVFRIASGVTVLISGLTIQNGAFTDVARGGGIFTQGDLTLDHVIVQQNYAFQGGGIFVWNNASLHANATIFSNNSISQATLDAVEFGGGGIACQSATLTLVNSTLSGNRTTTSPTSGGGLFSQDCNVTINSSTISTNSSTKGGGGIEASGSSSLLDIVDSTIGGNFSPDYGGGISNMSGAAGLYSTTVANNESGTLYSGAGIFDASAGTVSMANTILANNYERLTAFPYLYFDDCSGLLISQRYNLIATTHDCILTGQPGDRLNTPADLGVLSYNGGPTQTYALLPASPAIGSGNPSGCKDINGAILATDQRGDPRRVDRSGQMRCDIGAFQVQLNLFLPLLRK
jgi:hypothetical protein